MTSLYSHPHSILRNNDKFEVLLLLFEKNSCDKKKKTTDRKAKNYFLWFLTFYGIILLIYMICFKFKSV